MYTLQEGVPWAKLTWGVLRAQPSPADTLRCLQPCPEDVLRERQRGGGITLTKQTIPPTPSFPESTGTSRSLVRTSATPGPPKGEHQVQETAEKQ